MWSHFLIYLIFIVQITFAQLLPHICTNGILGGFSRGLPTVGNMVNGIKTQLDSHISNVNLGNMNSANIYNAINSNLPHTNLITDAKMPEVNLATNYGKQLITTNINDLPKAIAKEYLPNNNLVPNAEVFPILKGNDSSHIKRSNNVNIMNRIASGWKPKTITLNIGDPYAIINGKNDNSKLFLEIMFDSVDIHGTVSVSGSMPIYGAVTMNGNVPSNGKASVDFSSRSEKKHVTA